MTKVENSKTTFDKNSFTEGKNNLWYQGVSAYEVKSGADSLGVQRAAHPKVFEHPEEKSIYGVRTVR